MVSWQRVSKQFAFHFHTHIKRRFKIIRLLPRRSIRDLIEIIGPSIGRSERFPSLAEESNLKVNFFLSFFAFQTEIFGPKSATHLSSGHNWRRNHSHRGRKRAKWHSWLWYAARHRHPGHGHSRESRWLLPRRHDTERIEFD